MSPQISRVFGQLAAAVLETGAKRATKYLSENMTVKATVQGKPRKSDRHQTLIFTIGRPNFAEREFIKKCKRAGEPLPVRKVQLYFPKPRTAA